MESRSVIFKDRAGKRWFAGIYSNNFVDRAGDIISSAAHSEYAQWLKTSGVQPPVVVAHMPRFPSGFHQIHLLGLKTGRISVEEYNQNLLNLYKTTAFAVTKAVIPIAGFCLVIAEVLEDSTALPLVEKSLARWGMSHGFIVLKESGSIIDKYRTFEFTSAPANLVANILTTNSVITGEIEMAENPADVLFKGLSDEDREVIQSVLNADPDAMEDSLQEVRRVLNSVLDSKMLDATEKPDGVVEEPDMSAMVDQVLEKIHVPDLISLLRSLDARIKAVEAVQVDLQREDDEKIAEVWKTAPPIDWNLSVFGSDQEQALAETLKGDVPEKLKTDVVEPNPDNPMDNFWVTVMGSNGHGR